MTLTAERAVATVLREIRPREAFATELLAALIQDPNRLYALDTSSERLRTRWIVAGAVAGVVSATGVVYLAARRHKGAA